MNTRALNSLADLICRAQEQDRTPTGIAFAIDAAGRHMTPETAAELEHLRREVESNRVDGRRLILAEQRRAELEAVLGTHRKDDQAEIERLRARVAELEAERHSTNEALDDAVQELRARRGPDADRSADRLSRVLAPSPAGEHEVYVHHSYRTGRDLPERDDPARCLKTHEFSPRDGWRMVCTNCDHGKSAGCHRVGAS